MNAISNYTYITNYKDNTILRKSLNELTNNTYGFDFESWYKNGYWLDKYIPYSLVEGNRVIANVSANIMDFEINGQKKQYIQLGTVMTTPEYRNQGLCSFLIQKVIHEWKEKVNGIYLFANNTVLDFYPKFGFSQSVEYQYYKEIEISNLQNPCKTLCKKVDMSNKFNQKIFIESINSSVSNTKLAMKNNIGLIMFYTTSFLKDCIYYIPKINTYAIAEIKGNILILHDVISDQIINIELVIQAFHSFNITKIELGFTPHDTEKYGVSLLQENDTILFILGKDLECIANNKMMFPTLSHA